MFRFIWPIAVIVISNVFYQVCAKGVPDGMNPMVSVAVTYLVGALASIAVFFMLEKGGNLIAEVKKANWASFLLGIVIVGLETGYIFAYRAGWDVSKAPLLQSAVVAVILIFVGKLAYGEPITVKKLTGILVCLLGMVLLSGN